MCVVSDFLSWSAAVAAAAAAAACFRRVCVWRTEFMLGTFFVCMFYDTTTGLQTAQQLLGQRYFMYANNISVYVSFFLP